MTGLIKYSRKYLMTHPMHLMILPDSWVALCYLTVCLMYAEGSPPLSANTIGEASKYSSKLGRGSSFFLITPAWYLKSLDLRCTAPAMCAAMFGVPGIWFIPLAFSEQWISKLFRLQLWKMSTKFGAFLGTVNNRGKQSVRLSWHSRHRIPSTIFT